MKDFFKFLISKPFLKQLLYVFIFLGVVLFATLTWLGFYTNHGQKLDTPDYANQHIDDAREDAKDKTFQIIVRDSVHIVGKQGGLIIDQNPKAGAKVKENRKIYVNVTKYSPDKIKVSDLPTLYGKDYDQKRTELKFQDINTKVKSSRFDLGEPNHILEVWYEGQQIVSSKIVRQNVEIEKGGTLEFVISKPTGGSGLIPNLVCSELSAAEFQALSARFSIGNVEEEGEITDRNTAFVISQSPRYDGISTLNHNSEISVTISQSRPKDCE